MAIQNQGFRRDLNLLETEDDRNALDNLAGAGTNKDLAFLQNNLRNTSSIAYRSIDSEGFFSNNVSTNSCFNGLQILLYIMANILISRDLV